MAPVKPCVRLSQQFEDYRLWPLGTPFLTATEMRARAAFHLGADLLAHRAPRRSASAERIAAITWADLHHLFLVDV